MFQVRILPIGSRLRDRYQITNLLNTSSGFGITYEARDLDLPTQPLCVVKQLKLQNSINTTLFNRESETLYCLGEHERIPRLYAHFEEEGEFYLVQEFINGHDLSKEITVDRSLDEKETIDLLKEILEILAFVHQSGFIHRDLKPSNIMRRRDGKLLLIDFGAVRQITNENEISITVSLGTPGYMPSEQAIGRPTFASDIYALGMIAIFALTGIPPSNLDSSESGEIVWRNRVKVTEVSDKLANFLDKMVQFHFNQRYQNATKALDAINEIFDAPPNLPVGQNQNGTEALDAMNEIFNGSDDPPKRTVGQKFWNWLNTWKFE